MAFTVPWHSLFGGMLLGLSAVLLMLFSGKVAGISGIITGVLAPKSSGFGWKITFLIGMISSLFLVIPLGFELPNVSENNLIVIAVAGVLVGFGTRLANGCTSGHGIIGMGRLSKRSIVATLTFMASAIAVVFIKRQMGWM